jgi:type II secretory pathway component PulM
MNAIAERWAAMSPRERALLAAGAVVVVAALLYAFAWRPLVDDLPRAKRDAERAERRLASAQAAASAAAARATPPARAPLDAAIRGALARQGLAAGDATLEIAGERAAVTLPSVRFATLVALLDTLAREDAVHAVEATLTARVEAGQVRAELSLSR